MNLPLSVIDIHCDLLSYLNDVPGADPLNKEAIGCSLPALTAGNVMLQVMAIYTATEKGSSNSGLQQCKIFNSLPIKHDQFYSGNYTSLLSPAVSDTKIGILAAIENASSFCEEDEDLENGFSKLEEMISQTGRIFYIGFTHHGENRFGGGNSTKIGLKHDGKALLEYMSGKKIAFDFSHTSDVMAYDVLNYIDRNNLDVPVLASHSNFRKIFDHPRNLPDELAKEIIHRKGLIGINFLRAFLNNTDPEAIYNHIQYGMQLGGHTALCFGADYFYTDSHPDQTRKPFFFKEQGNAGCYPDLLNNLSKQFSLEQLQKISHQNAVAFLKRTSM